MPLIERTEGRRGNWDRGFSAFSSFGVNSHSELVKCTFGHFLFYVVRPRSSVCPCVDTDVQTERSDVTESEGFEIFSPA